MSLAPEFYMANSMADWVASVPRSATPMLLLHAWYLWRRRCKFIFEGTLEPWQLVLHYAASVDRLLHEHGGPSSATLGPRWVHWRSPPDGWVALNVDGSSLGNPGRAGAGGVVRNAAGVWQFGFTAFVGISEILQAELLAIFFGLRLCWQRGIRRVIVFSDSRHALNVVMQGCGSFHAHAAVFELIRELMDKDWQVRFEHILREGNAVADVLAKDGASGNSRFRFLASPPPAAIPLLAEDYRGTLFLRP